MTEIIFGILGALIGGSLAVTGQLVVRRREEREHWVSVLLEEAARLAMLEDIYMTAVWVAFHEHNRQPLQDWPLGDRQMAAAKLRLVSTDSQLGPTVEDLRKNGRTLFHLTAPGMTQNAFDLHLDLHRSLLENFIATAQESAPGTVELSSAEGIRSPLEIDRRERHSSGYDCCAARAMFERSMWGAVPSLMRAPHIDTSRRGWLAGESPLDRVELEAVGDDIS